MRVYMAEGRRACLQESSGGSGGGSTCGEGGVVLVGEAILDAQYLVRNELLEIWGARWCN